jgi:hypothetical protein
MTHSIASKLLFSCVSVAAYAAHALAMPAVAQAQIYAWHQDVNLPGYAGNPGCATEIAVGSNNVPWVIGCSGPGDNGTNRSVYYWLAGGPRSWVYASGAGTSLTVADDGEPWLLTSNGHVWRPNPPVQSFQWYDVMAQQSGTAFGAGLLSSLALTDAWPAYELFETPTVSENYIGLFGIGYSSAQNRAVFQSDVSAQSGYAGWSQVDPQQGAAGTKIVVFTRTELNGVEVPMVVVLNSQGNIYSYSQSTGTFTQMPLGFVTDITDSFAIAGGAVYQYSYASGTWTAVASGTSPQGFNIVRVAAAPYQTVLTNGGGTYGPSALWALDAAGYIYSTSTAIQLM